MVLAIRGHVDGDSAVSWWIEAFTELHRLLRTAGISRTGPDGAEFPTEFFTEGAAELVAFVPVDRVPALAGRVEAVGRPAVRYAVALHDGPMVDLDGAYSAVGRDGRRAGAGLGRARWSSATCRWATRTTSSPTAPRCAGRVRRAPSAHLASDRDRARTDHPDRLGDRRPRGDRAAADRAVRHRRLDPDPGRHASARTRPRCAASRSSSPRTSRWATPATCSSS